MNAKSHHTTPPAKPDARPEVQVSGLRFSDAALPLVFVAIVLVGVGAASVYALATLVFDGAWAAAVMVPAGLAGLWLVPLLGLGELPLRWHVLLGSALGIGLLCLSVLALGCAGVLSRGLWIAVLVVLFVIGAVRAVRVVTAARRCEPDQNPNALRWLSLLLAPMLILGVLAAVHAPGFLWLEEGWGYDALEYHLELPKEYHTAGEIRYTPHNVYGNFPANVEMLYLLGMIVRADDMDSGTTAHMIHLSFAMLTVFAAYVGGREWSRRGGWIAAITMGSAGWLAYLSGLAYVENGMLFFGIVAATAALRAIRTRTVEDPQDDGAPQRCRSARWSAAAGLCAGLASGCKYTGIPMIAIPITLSALLVRAQPLRRLGLAGAAGIAAVLAFSPWAIKNMVMTGNPVFPLANVVFHAEPAGWRMAESHHWDACHSVRSELNHARAHGETATPNESVLALRLRKLWDNIAHDRYTRFGPLLLVLALWGCLAARRDRGTGALALMLAVQLLVWMFATHLYARFAVVILIPLALLAGRCVRDDTRPRTLLVLVGVLVVGVGVNFTAMGSRYRAEGLPGAIAPAALIYGGRLPGYEHLHTINRELPEDAHILVLGDAKAFYYDRPIDYCVVFNRNPFVEAIQKNPKPSAVGSWLRERGYTHVLVDQSEIDRLRASAYGFPREINLSLFDGLERAGYLTPIAIEGAAKGAPTKRLYEVVP